MAVEGKCFIFLIYVLLVVKVQCQSIQDSAESEDKYDGIGQENEDGPQSMAEAYLDYISGGHKFGPGSAGADTGSQCDGLSAAETIEASRDAEDSSPMDMLLRKYMGKIVIYPQLGLFHE